MMKPTFNEESHEYKLGKKVLVPTTTLLRLAEISPDYSAVNEHLLDKRAKYGSFIHKEMENYIKNNDEGLTVYPRLFQKWLNENNFIVVGSEVMVWDKNFAGIIDLIVKNVNTDDYYIYDFKTTSTIHRRSVGWQTSIYAHLWSKMTKNRVVGVGAIHLINDEFKPVSLLMKSANQVGELFTWYLTNRKEKFIKEVNVPELDTIADLETEIKKHEAIIESLKKEKEGLYKILDNELELANATQLENDKIVFTKILPFEKASFDTASFKKDNPELYAKYATTKMSEPQYRIKFKKGNNNNE